MLTREGAAENGDTVDIDFEGFVDGKAFEGGKADLPPGNELLFFIGFSTFRHHDYFIIGNREGMAGASEV